MQGNIDNSVFSLGASSKHSDLWETGGGASEERDISSSTHPHPSSQEIARSQANLQK